MRIVALVPAAGLGVRMAGGKSAKGATPPKQLLELDGVPILFLTLRQLAACRRLERLIVAVRSSDRGAVEALLKKEGYAARVTVVAGGDSPPESVARAPEKIPPPPHPALVPAAARPPPPPA